MKCPNDTTDDYEFDAAIDGFGSYDDFEIGEYGSYDEDYSSGVSEILSAAMYYEISDEEYDPF